MADSSQSTYELIMVRHGESVWNKENRFTGWKDVDLSETGLAEAHRAGRLLKEMGLVFECAHTSVLKRAIRTLWIMLDEMDLMWIPEKKSWRLNERHYGALTGLNKSETAAKHGEDQVRIWRRSFDVPPPPLSDSDQRHPRFEARYQNVDSILLPGSEALKQTVERVVPYWRDQIVPDLTSGKRVLMVAHGNSIRAIIKYLEDPPDSEIVELNIPTAVPIRYRFDSAMKPIGREYLGDAAEIERAIHAVAAQGRAKKP